MKITKRQLRNIIREEKRRLNEQGPREYELDIERDMSELLALVEKAQGKAAEISVNMKDVEYGQWAGGREADDLQLALHKVWEVFGMNPEDL
jgi:hypothetical protein